MAKKEDDGMRSVVCIHTINAPDELGMVSSNRPGTIIKVEKAEAERLVKIGAAAYPDLDDDETAAKVEVANEADDNAKDESDDAGDKSSGKAGGKASGKAK